MKLRKLTFDGHLEPMIRYDFLLNGVQTHISNLIYDGEFKRIVITDIDAIEIIKAMGGVKTQIKPFAYGGVKEEWIPL